MRIVIETKSDAVMGDKDIRILKSVHSIFIDMKSAGSDRANIIKAAQAVKNLSNANFELN